MPKEASNRHAPKNLTLRRRKPRQERSYLTVASILEATERLARDEGFHRLETARIAAVAGVSIGSLYQYFANLDAIVLGLYEQRSAEIARSMKAAMVAIVEKPPETALPGIMDLILRLHERHRLILIQLVDEMPHLQLREHSTSVDVLARGSVGHYLMHRRPNLKPADLNRQVFFLEKIVLGCVRSYLQNRAGVARKAFIGDLAQICAQYLASSP